MEMIHEMYQRPSTVFTFAEFRSSRVWCPAFNIRAMQFHAGFKYTGEFEIECPSPMGPYALALGSSGWEEPDITGLEKLEHMLYEYAVDELGWDRSGEEQVEVMTATPGKAYHVWLQAEEMAEDGEAADATEPVKLRTFDTVGEAIAYMQDLQRVLDAVDQEPIVSLIEED